MNKNTDWKSFKLDLQEKININVNLSVGQLEIDAEKFTRLIQEIAHKNTKESITQRKSGNYSGKKEEREEDGNNREIWMIKPY